LAGCAVVFIPDTLAPQFGVRVEMVEATAQCEADSRGHLGVDDVEADLQNIRLEIRVHSADSESDVQHFTRLGRSAARFIWPSPKR